MNNKLISKDRIKILKQSLSNALDAYFKKRKIAEFYACLIYTGHTRKNEIKKMMKSKVLKPSQVKIRKTIDKSQESYKRLLRLLEQEEMKLVIDEISLDDIQNLKIKKLDDCKTLYDTYEYIGILGQKKLGFLFKMLFKPFGVTIIEFILICIVVSIYMYVKRYVSFFFRF